MIEGLKLRIENASVERLLVVLVLAVLLFGFLYFDLGIWETGSIVRADGSAASLLDCIYFSCMTISTLGCGDLLPTGLSKIVAVAEVFFGLGIVAAVITRILSDRDSRVIGLIYLREQQRKLRELARSLDDRIRSFSRAASKDDVVRMVRLVQRVRVYCNGELENADLLRGENIGFIVAIHRQLLRLLRVDGGVATVATDKFRAGRVRYLLKQIEGIVNEIDNGCQVNGLAAIRDEVRGEILNQRGIARAMKRRIGKVRFELIDEIKESLPRPPWPRDFHETVAKELRIPLGDAYLTIGAIRSQLNEKVEDAKA